MKSFKKLFALVLVVAMFASFGIGATAAFTDAADIDNTAAVQLISDLGVMTGYPDGSFKPDGNITRAEMAKIIVALKYGAATTNSLQGTYTVTGFTDVKPDFWAAAYIGICKNTGVINGVTPTTFNPSGNVKTVDAVKMILATLGYGKKGEYVGAGYSTNVLLDGLNAGIFTGAENLNAFATRDQIAAFVKTAIFATLQSFDSDTGLYSDVTTTNKDTLAGKTFGMLTAKGVVVANAAYDLVDGKVDLEDQALTAIWVDTATNPGVIDTAEVTRYAVATDASLIGETVTVYYKNTAKTTAVNAYDYFPGYSCAKVTKSVSFETTTNAAEIGSVAFGPSYSLEASALYYVNGKASTKNDSVYHDYDANTEDAVHDYQLNKALYGSLVKYIDIDADKKIELVLVEKSSVAKISYIAADGTITAGTTYKTKAATATAAAVTVADGLAKGDYVLIQSISDVTTVTKAAMVSGKVESYSTAGYKISGGDYKVAAKNVAGDKYITIATDNYTNAFNYFLNAKGYIVDAAAAGAIVGNNYAVVLDSAVIDSPASDVGGAASKALRLQVLFLSGDKAGTTEKVTASSIVIGGKYYAAVAAAGADGSKDKPFAYVDTDAAGSTSLATEQVQAFTYTVNSITGKYALTEVAAADSVSNTTGDLTISKKVQFAIDTPETDKYVASSSTVFVVRTGAGSPASPFVYTVYTGYANVPAMTTAKLTAVTNAADVVTIAYIYGGGATATAPSYVYVTNDNSTANYYYNGGDDYYTYNAIVDGQVTELKSDAADKFAAAGLYTVTYKNGMVDTVGNTTTFNGLDTGNYVAADGVLKANGTYYTYTGSETVYVINTAAKTVSLSSVEGVSSLITATKDTNTSNAGADGTISILVVANTTSPVATNPVTTVFVLYTAPQA